MAAACTSQWELKLSEPQIKQGRLNLAMLIRTVEPLAIECD